MFSPANGVGIWRGCCLVLLEHAPSTVANLLFPCESGLEAGSRVGCACGDSIATGCAGGKRTAQTCKRAVCIQHGLRFILFRRGGEGGGEEEGGEGGGEREQGVRRGGGEILRRQTVAIKPSAKSQGCRDGRRRGWRKEQHPERPGEGHAEGLGGWGLSRCIRTPRGEDCRRHTSVARSSAPMSGTSASEASAASELPVSREEPVMSDERSESSTKELDRESCHESEGRREGKIWRVS